MMRIRTGMVVMVVLSFALVLSACGSATPTVTPVPPTSVPPTVAAAATAVPTAAATAAGTAAATTGLKIGLVTDVGKVDDRSFNQSAWEGAQQGATAVGGTADYIETQSSEDYASNIQQFADKDYNVIITVGFALGDATIAAAKKYPNIKFISVDNFQTTIMDNLTGLSFHEDQSGFLAGFLAGKMTKSNLIAGVYGTDQVPPVVRYKEGFEQGAKYANPAIKVISTYYPGGIDKAFSDPDWGAQTAGQAIDQGADIVFGAGGKTGNGALQEVAKRTTTAKPLYCIGVDTDQWDTVPEAHPCLITSAEKLITPGLVTLIKQAAAGTIQGGNFIGDVDVAPFHDFDSIVSDAIKAQLADIRTQVLAGKIDTTGPTETPAPVASAAATMPASAGPSSAATSPATMAPMMAPTAAPTTAS